METRRAVLLTLDLGENQALLDEWMQLTLDRAQIHLGGTPSNQPTQTTSQASHVVEVAPTAAVPTAAVAPTNPPTVIQSEVLPLFRTGSIVRKTKLDALSNDELERQIAIEASVKAGASRLLAVYGTSGSSSMLEGADELNLLHQNAKDNLQHLQTELSRRAAALKGYIAVSIKKPLGLTFNGKVGKFEILKVKPEGNAAATGYVIPGMLIVSVNGTSTEGLASKVEVTALIKETVGPVCKLELLADPNAVVEAGAACAKACDTTNA